MEATIDKIIVGKVEATVNERLREVISSSLSEQDGQKRTMTIKVSFRQMDSGVLAYEVEVKNKFPDAGADKFISRMDFTGQQDLPYDEEEA